MKTKDTHPTDAAELRKQAEALAKQNAAQSPEQLAPLSPEATKLALHDLRVHQIELEMQNEELRRAQAELDATRARYFDLYDVAPVGYVTISEKGLILEANLTASSLLGAVRGSLATKPIWPFVLKEDQDICYHYCKQLFETETPQACELRMVKKDGSVFWARLEATVARNAVAAPMCRVVLSDITVRKQAEEKLRKSEEQFREVLENSLDASYKRNLQTDTYDYLSPVFARISGYAPEEMKSLSFEAVLNFIHPDDLSETKRVVAESMYGAPGKAYQIDYRFKHKEGQYRWFEDLFTVMRDAQGHPLARIGSVSDITERKRVEAEKEKLELQNRQLQKAESLGRMAGAIAHHFNNQLQVVMMNLQMAMQTLPRNAEPVENLTEAMQSARKAAGVSTQMLTYLGQTAAKYEPLDLCEVCQHHLPMLRTVMPQGVTLKTELDSHGPVVNANANQIQQILTNLLTNAWEAMGETQGVIRLIVKTVQAADIPSVNRFPIDCQAQDQPYACLEVADAGCGIANKDIEKLFDPFFSTKFTGRGLGLSVILGIVRAHDGCVTVESQPGHGSVFGVFLPLTTKAIPQKPIQVAQGPKAAGCGTVLVVDDEPYLRKAVTLVLKRSGFTVYEAKDGVEAVEVFQQHRDEIGCVLCDLTMPRMDGWETLTALRKLAPDIPVILSSGYSEAQAMAGEHPELPQAFLSKPYEWTALKDVIVRVMGNR
jgi:two-component system, cell cycle sensor histidine kinase and response regulator CckA